MTHDHHCDAGDDTRDALRGRQSSVACMDAVATML